MENKNGFVTPITTKKEFTFTVKKNGEKPITKTVKKG